MICYLLGISHVDPIKYNIKFSRFLNEFRDNLPDIDYDFPYNMRDEVFLKLQMRWPGKIARISNHVYYHEKSAKREGLRRIGMKGFISKYASEHPRREDIAESVVAWVAARCKQNRIDKSIYNQIINTIPNRLKILDNIIDKNDTYPLVCKY